MNDKCGRFSGTLCYHGLENINKCQPGEFKMREIFDFSYTLKLIMTNTFTDDNKCPSYKGACLIEVIFNKNATLNHRKVSAIEKFQSCVSTRKFFH